jgi:phospholipid/cholesterol/gamma-HCH transport system substrate-binding protein
MNAIVRAEAARRKAVRAGVVLVAGMACALAFAVTARNGLPGYLPGVSRTALAAEFVNVEALRPGDDVRIANVRVGFVDSIRREDGHAVVEMRLDDGRKVYEDASAVIAARSALGQKYVELSPGSESAGELPDGATLDLAHTKSPVELDTVLDALDAKTRSSLRTVLRETGGGLGGHGQDLNDAAHALPGLVEDLGQISRALTRDGGSDTAELLEAADHLAVTLDTQESVLAGLVEHSADTLEAVGVDDDAPLGDTLATAPDALVRIRSALASLDEPLVETGRATRALRPGAVALAAATPSLRRFLRDAVGPLEKVPAVADVAGPAVTALTGTVEEATPVVKQASTALERAQIPLSVLAPYSPEVMLFFRNAASALQYGDASGNWLRFYVVVNSQIASGVLPVQDPLLQRDAYPEPGTAHLHYTSSLGGGQS